LDKLLPSYMLFPVQYVVWRGAAQTRILDCGERELQILKRVGCTLVHW
jgi:hypothetical protein